MAKKSEEPESVDGIMKSAENHTTESEPYRAVDRLSLQIGTYM